ncbi:phosphatidylinositol-specific phospholipase C/glycerophosphodiester phosphodiesterase family protein [Blastococcus mobilis]|uniref:Altered inheritance of mitochondria protein 6 n=1 Tax=Blastococcus mobilis TaxID=1938746 RepID=A0A238YB11_9ACTN|nr:phosphatidylinositol-specific phospholipase C/glycerophosphodiester phosphodiesterase family protein [Blastococcus mobilis]SNR67941.1 Glycerophosphoryl diester phosphodiesterase [Blastococcus mobilis]
MGFTRRTLTLVAAAAAALTAPTITPAAAAPPTSAVEPLERAHAHNDYEHDRPLADALDHGFTSVEADVWLVDGELRVAHDLEDTRAGATLQSLYLDPLADRFAANGGSIYRGWDGSLQLLIDIKSDGPSTYAAIDEALRAYPQLMTRWTDGRMKERAVTAVISGNRPLADMAVQRTRFAGYDGRLTDLHSGLPSELMPLVSDNWTRHFTWTGVGPMPEAEREKLHSIVATAHAHGYRLRFWATPDTPGAERDAVWSELIAAGVDHVNTDDLAGLQAFLLAHDPRERKAA